MLGNNGPIINFNKKQINKIKKKELLTKWKEENTLYCQKYKNKICNNHNIIWSPPLDIKYDSIQTHSWFTLNKCINNKKSNVDNIDIISKENVYNKCNTHNKFNIDGKEKESIKCNKINMHLTDTQQEIFNNWFKAYSVMYNKTLKYIKDNKEHNIKGLLNWKTLRTTHLKDIKNEVIEGSKMEKYKNCQIKCHMLDGAIKLACSNYKSAITNFKRGHIKNFRIRYWKISKSFHILDIERSFIQENKKDNYFSICPKIFGKIKCTYNGEDFNMNDIREKYKCDVKIHHDKVLNKYTLLVPEKVEQINKQNKSKLFGGDLGVSTFLTGISENDGIMVGSNVCNVILKNIKKVEEIKGKSVPSKIKKKYERRYNKRITNMVDDLHWKTINYLVNNYMNILIGDISTKGIVKNGKSNIHVDVKKVAQRLKFYEFRQRLENKCKINGLEYRVIDEKYTSKMCTKCGNIDEELGGKKIYSCKKCGLKINRDYGGARGITIKGTERKE